MSGIDRPQPAEFPRPPQLRRIAEQRWAVSVLTPRRSGVEQSDNQIYSELALYRR
jgi:hypothetical protein